MVRKVKSGERLACGERLAVTVMIGNGGELWCGTVMAEAVMAVSCASIGEGGQLRTAGRLWR